MRPRHLFPSLALAVSALLSSIASTASAAPTVLATGAASSASVVAATSQPSQKDQLLYMLNAERARAGRAPLALRDGIANVAREWAAGMARDWSLRHRPNLGDGLRAQGVTWRRIGENVGYGSHVSDVQRRFMGSASHRDTLLNSAFSQVGIGVTARDGRVWVTVDFVG